MSAAAVPSVVVPDLIEPVVGWRSWQAVVGKGGAVALGSVVYRTRWPLRAALAARCEAENWQLPAPWRGRRDHVAPAPDCGCGIYAVPDVERVLQYLERGAGGWLRPVVRVLGLVQLWGRVLECERGWRAERAYPLRLYVVVPPTHRRSGSEHGIVAGLGGYGVPVEILESSIGSLIDELARRREPLDLRYASRLPETRGR